MTGKFEITRSKSGKFMFNLKAGNGEIILTSQLYTRKSGAKRGAESVMCNCGRKTCFHKKMSRNKKPFFVLKAKNGQVIGKSEMYNSKRAMENGISSVMKNGRRARMTDCCR